MLPRPPLPPLPPPPLAAPPTLLERWTRPQLSLEALLLLAAGWFALLPNRGFVQGALQASAQSGPPAWGLALALLLGLAALHLLLLAALATRRSAKPLLGALLLVSAVASFYMRRYGVTLDPTMLRNVLATHWAEAGELIGAALVAHLLLHAALPMLLLWRVRLVARPWRQAVARRLLLVLAAAGLLVASLWSVFQPFASLMRNHKELRYQVTPANVLWSLAQVAGSEARARGAPRQAIGLDARPGPAWAGWARPQLLVLVVGETARAANWGLSGYTRNTTPQLAALPVVNFADVQSCGTNTEVSLPCMFAPVGRRDYDEARIRGSESLLHLLARAGVGVGWRDNQSGCKGVCEGLPTQTVHELAPPALCDGRHCLDEGLLHALPELLRHSKGVQLLVLHQLGNHGPSYFRRYPPAYAQFQPECRSDDLQACTREQIVNAYDNALLYTDAQLARLVGLLGEQAGRVDSALIYVSDHGESLGENGLYLHGLPRAIAPAVQTQVPMVMWTSDGFAAARGLDLGCLRQRAQRPAAHDHLFHTVLGLLDVQTTLYARDWDLTADCRHRVAAA